MHRHYHTVAMLGQGTLSEQQQLSCVASEQGDPQRFVYTASPSSMLSSRPYAFNG